MTVLLSFELALIKESAHDRMLMQQRPIENQALFRQMTETVDVVFWAITADANRLQTYSVETDLNEKLKRIYYFAKRMAKTVPSAALVEPAT